MIEVLITTLDDGIEYEHGETFPTFDEATQYVSDHVDEWPDATSFTVTIEKESGDEV